MCFIFLQSFQFTRSVVLNFATPWIAARQASLSITNSWSSPKLMSIELVVPSNHGILCRPCLLLPQSFPTSGSFKMSQLFTLGGQSIGVSASASVLPMSTQDWSTLRWTGWISLQSKGLSRVFHLLLDYAGQEATLRTGHGTTDWFQIGKRVVKAVYCHPAYLTYMQSTSWETLGWKKQKLESRLPGEISITSDMHMTPPLW